MDMKFCRRCGTSLTAESESGYRCTNGHNIYANASPAIALILENERGEVAAVKRGQDPGKGYWDLPGGFAERNETLERTVGREIEEEIGLTESQYSRPVLVSTFVDAYDFGGETMSVLSCVFYARLTDPNVELRAMDDAEEVRFMPATKASADSFYFKGLSTGLVNFLDNAAVIRQMSDSTV